MKFISHRGNIDGPNPQTENNPTHLKSLIDLGFLIEIDAWKVDNAWFLGHDTPTYRVSNEFLQQDNFWVHCKNIEALESLRDSKVNYFWHQRDSYTLTSHGYIWTFPDLSPPLRGVIVDLSEDWKGKNYSCFVCSDYE